MGINFEIDNNCDERNGDIFSNNRSEVQILKANSIDDKAFQTCVLNQNHKHTDPLKVMTSPTVQYLPHGDSGENHEHSFNLNNLQSSSSTCFASSSNNFDY